MTPPSTATDLPSLIRRTRRLLLGWSAAGIQELPRGQSRRAAGKAAWIKPVLEEALACRKCRLCQSRTTVVFGEGTLEAKLVFVGEGPGRDEDAQGRPFVGAAGKLLTKMIQAMGLTRESVYIANVVKCRPPMNRPPQPDEVEACSAYLAAQLKIIAPCVICALGKTASGALLKTDLPMAQLRGKTFAWEGIPVVATFHPAYLLRNPGAKPEAWEDLKRVLALLAP